MLKRFAMTAGVAALLPFASGYLCAEQLAGRTYDRAIGQDFPFTNAYEDFAGLTFNPISRTFFTTDNKKDVILEFNPDSTLIRAINIAGLKNPAEAEADAEGITWMYGQTYAIVMEGGEEMAVVRITPTTSSIIRSEATIYSLSGDPKGVTYKASENALYWVSEEGPMRVVKARINPATGNLDTLANINVNSLPASALADVAYFPRLSPHLFLISHSSRTIMEVDVAASTPTLKSAFSLAAWPIPEAGALTFDADGKMIVVGKHVANTPEDDYNVFMPTAPIVNRAPNARIASSLAP